MFGGFGVSSSPAFGASSASLFGGATSAASAGPTFSNPFGSATPAPSPFGQSSASAFGGGFGAPQSSAGAFSFGTPQSSAAAFGTQQSSANAFSFGTPSSAAGGFASSFGTPQSSAATFSFGGTPQQSAPSLFGGSQFSSPFGSTATGAAGNTPGLFSQTPPQQQAQPAFGGFNLGGAANSQAQTQLAAAPLAAGISDPRAAAEVEAIAAAFGLSQDPVRSRFLHLFLNVVNNPAARQRPPHVDALQWRQAIFRAGGEHNKHGLWPVPAMGFGDLLARKSAQDAAIAEHEERMRQAQRAVAELVQKQGVLVQAGLQKVRREHLVLSARLLSLMRKIDMLEARSAGALGLYDSSCSSATAAVSRSLDAIEAKLAPSAPNGLQRRVDSLAAAAHLQSHAGSAPEDSSQMSEKDLAEVYSILKSHSEAVTRLQHVLGRVTSDVAVLAKAGKQKLHQ
ncbi:hypothetical protein WJX73_000635 [Symbiochloris irregularis]|uniref:Nucleoporin Nup54 alpha-helical domain-containing protein n=1 Tax=Symbiochloris irregularis TaxID=706552 RepID=A0AAW1PX40_9CHLO